MKKTLAVFTSVLLYFISWGQNAIGLPEIINYSKQVYKAGTQNWDICQDINGILYFANNEGLLSFDGTYWKICPLPNKTIVRSVAIAADNKIYVGGQNEIGFFSPNKLGDLEYHSIKYLIPEKNRSFSDVWDVICFNNEVFFRSNDQIFQLTNNRITVYPTVSSWLFAGATPDIVIAQDFSKGVARYEKGAWITISPRWQLPEGFLVTAVMKGGNDSTFVTSLKHGIFLYTHNQLAPFSSPALKTIAAYNIYGAIALSQDLFALGTTQKGCIIIDKKGNPVQQFSRLEGLQTNNVLSIFSDRNKNLWLGLDHGIDFIAYNNAIKNVYPDPQNEGSGYSSIIHNNRLYIATTNGLYQVPLYNQPDLSFVKGYFTMVNHTQGQVWNLSEADGKLLMGHHEGFMEIKDNSAIVVDNSTGFWTFLSFNNQQNGNIIAGTYNGIRVYNYKAGRFLKAYKEASFESSRFVAISDSDIWVSHPYKGIYRVRLQPNGELTTENYNTKHGLDPDSIGNYVFKIKNRIVATTQKGIYEYDQQTGKFEASARFNAIFGKTIIRYLKEDGEGNIWFVFDKSLGIVDFSEGEAKVIYVPELNGKMVSGFEQVYPVDGYNIFVGAEKGFFHINYIKYRQNHPSVQVQIRQVKAINKTDSLLFGGYFADVNGQQLQRGHVSVPFKWNSFRFEFSAPLYEQQANIQYSYHLDGYDGHWSDWNAKTEKEYSYLPAGSYHFEVKARNNVGNESAIYTYSFVIQPPWYQTWWAYVLYGCLLLWGCYILYRWQTKKFVQQSMRYDEKQKRLRDLHQLELEKNEKEIVKLRNEKLEAEIQHKNKEMASATMHLVKKGELITRLKDELQHLTKITEDEKSLDALKKMIKALGEDDKTDADWEHFTVHFDKTHNDFFVALKEKHNNLTSNELKLCAYLRMNLSTKEMAQLMNISGRGVEISRYRLRKKLQIPTETNLFNYLLEFHANEKRSI